MNDLRTAFLSAGGVLLMALVFLACLTPWLVTRGDPSLPPLGFAGGIAAHPLGTDALGRDMLHLCADALGTSLKIAFAAFTFQIVLGYVIGAFAVLTAPFPGALFSGFAVVLRQISFPLLALGIMALLRSEQLLITRDEIVLAMIAFVLAVTGWPRIALAVHEAYLSTRNAPFVRAAQEIGASRVHVFHTHIAPIAERPIRLASVTVLAETFWIEAVIGFLGLGMPAGNPSLGVLFAEEMRWVTPDVWWSATVPALVLGFLLLSISMIAHRLTEAYLALERAR